MDWERLQRFAAWQAYGVAGMVATVYKAGDADGYCWIVVDADNVKVADGIADTEDEAKERCGCVMGATE